MHVMHTPICDSTLFCHPPAFEVADNLSVDTQEIEKPAVPLYFPRRKGIISRIFEQPPTSGA